MKEPYVSISIDRHGLDICDFDIECQEEGCTWDAGVWEVTFSKRISYGALLRKWLEHVNEYHPE